MKGLCPMISNKTVNHQEPQYVWVWRSTKTIKMFKEYFVADHLSKTTKELIKKYDLCEQCKHNNC